MLKETFSLGHADPYLLLLVSTKPDSIFSELYFDLEHSFIKHMYASQSRFIDRNSVQALSYDSGRYISFNTVKSVYYNTSSRGYSSPEAKLFRSVAAQRVNGDRTAAFMTIKPIVNPDSDDILPFVSFVRSLLTGEISVYAESRLGYLRTDE